MRFTKINDADQSKGRNIAGFKTIGLSRHGISTLHEEPFIRLQVLPAWPSLNPKTWPIRFLALACILVLSLIHAVAEAATATTLVPAAAPIGARVIAVGAGLDATGMGVAFSAGGAATKTAAIISATSTLIEIAVPTGAVTGPVVISQNGAIVSTLSFMVTPDVPFVTVATLIGQDGKSYPLKQPTGAAVRTPDGTLFLADTKNHRIVAISPAGVFSVVAGSGHPGSGDGTGTAAEFHEPAGICYDPTTAALFVADTLNNVVRKVTPAGVVTTFAGSGHPGDVDQLGLLAEFKHPAGITVSLTGDLYVADTGNHKVKKISPSGQVLTIAGTGKPSFVDGPAASSGFKQPAGLAIGDTNVLFVADTHNDAVRRIESGVVSTVVGASGSPLNGPIGISIDPTGDLIVADSGNNSIKRIDLSTTPPTVSTIAGTSKGDLIDGTPANARFKEPSGLSLGGALFVADTGNNAARALYFGTTLAAIYPTKGPVAGGNTVQVFGSGFVPGRTQVAFGGTSATNPLFVTSTETVVMVPASLASVVDVSVTTPAGQASLTGAYSYLNPPTISSVTPGKGKTAGGDAVDVRGTEFDDTQTVVRFGTQDASSVQFVSPGRVTVTTPPGSAGAVPVTVVMPGGQATEANGFVYLNPPTVTSVTPAVGGTAGGYSCQIQGTNFSSGDTQILFGSVAATNVVVADQGNLTATVPAGTAGTVSVTVRTPGGEVTLPGAYVYVAPPTVTSVTPAIGSTAGGTICQIKGTNFSSANTNVLFGTVSATGVIVTGQGTLTATAPAGSAGTVSITVQTPGGRASLPNGFVYLAPPTIASIIPATGPTAGGTVCQVQGANFSAGNTTVLFGTVAATTVTVNSPGTLTATAPAGATGTVSVAVQTPGGLAALGTGFSYIDPPVISGFSPTSGLPGTQVVITGSGFGSSVSANAVSFGGIPAAVLAATPTQLVVLVPAGGHSGSIGVAGPGGSVLSATGFTVILVASVLVSPSTIPLQIGSTAQLSAQVVFGDGTAADVTGQAVWSTSNASTTTVSNGGGVQGAGNGMAVITATYQGILGTGLAVVSTPETIPPDPATVAPALTPGVTSTVGSAMAFLYSGPSPIQTGVAAGTIQLIQAAALRGKVVSQDGLPLPGVAVTIFGRPELGRTVTRSDGMYDLAVNGGGNLVLQFAKPGLLSVQRQTQVRWQQYVQLPDVVMTALDPAVTTVNLSQVTSVQVARGSKVSDTDGARQATLLFQPGTQATMTFQNGTTQPLTIGSVRATEFTVGANGPNAMPGSLPPASGYTYCAEFSIDQAIAVGANSVSFNQPVIFYLENFLNFPVGVVVPTGWLDRTKGQWIASPNGKVVSIVSVTGGQADLDIDGDGVADNATKLAALGITDQERTRLSALYSVGTTLWRVPIDHFSVWDANWPYGPPPDATTPGQQPPGSPQDNDDPCEKAGSIIECQNQVLGQRLKITGTGSTLNYRSSRVPGRRTTATIRIPLSGTTVPASLKRIEVQVSVAGRKYFQTFGPGTNQEYMFEWDGKDVCGRAAWGTQLAEVKLGWVYAAHYYATKLASQAGFGRLVGEGWSSSDVLTIDKGRAEFVSWQTTNVPLLSASSVDIVGLGGWTLEEHHAYDPVGLKLYYGNGDRRSTQGNKAQSVINTLANVQAVTLPGWPTDREKYRHAYATVGATGPDGSVFFIEYEGTFNNSDNLEWGNRVWRIGPDRTTTAFAGQGPSTCAPSTVATSACLNRPEELVMGPAGDLFILDGDGLKKVTPSGAISCIAGCGTAPLTIGMPALGMRLENTGELAVGPDGSIFFISIIGTNESQTVIRVGTDGIVSRVAGGAVFGGFSGDGGPAAAAKLGTGLTGLAVSPDGSLFVSDYENYRIRRIGPDGVISTYAGTGVSTIYGDGGPATQAGLEAPENIAVSQDGTLYYFEAVREQIRRITPDGIITTIAGTSRGNGLSPTAPDGTAALKTQMPPAANLVPGPDGNIYFDYNPWTLAQTSYVRSFHDVLSGLSTSNITIPSEDGEVLYVFSAEGRHLRTVETHTAATLKSFTYDTNGHLSAVTDGDGNATQIQHDSAGRPVAIIAPGGQQTTFVVDGNGYLSAIKDPAGEGVTIQSSSDGLMTSLADARGNTHTFQYDHLGRLLQDTSPAGGAITLDRTDSGVSSYAVRFHSAMGRLFSYQFNSPDGGDTTQTNTLPNGLSISAVQRRDGTESVTNPDGSLWNRTWGPSPRWGFLAPLPTQTTLKLPSGLTYTASVTQTATLASPGDPLSLTAEETDTNVNGVLYQTWINPATRTYTSRNSLTNRTLTRKVDGQGRVVQEQLGNLLPFSYTYDARGRLTDVTQGSGSTLRNLHVTYDALYRPSVIIDALGQSVTIGYDQADRPTSTALPLNRQLGFTYDASGNIASLTPPGQPAHLFDYTAVDLESTYTPPALASGPTPTSFTYDRDQALTGVARPDGQSITVGYDTAGRVSTLTTPTGSISYVYDTSSGDLKRVTGPDGATAFTYDGPLTTSISETGAASGLVGFTWDNNFRIISETLNGTNAVSYSYDYDGLLRAAGSMTLNRDYGSQTSLLTGSVLGTVSDTRTYSGFGEPAAYGASAGSTSLLSQQFVRDQFGRITQKTETIGGQTAVYGYQYDAAGRLTDVTLGGAPLSHYAYDANGNRTAAQLSTGSVTATYDAQDRLLTYGPLAYTYSANGELQSESQGSSTVSYTYDVLGNLKTTTLADGTRIDYLIDGLNRRIGKKINGTLVKGFVYRSQLQPAAELDGSGTLVARFVYGTRVNVPEYMVKGTTTYRIITDHLGSPRLVVNSSDGSIAQRLDYDEFGNVILDTNPGFQPFGFAGGLYDYQTGLVRFGTRDYDPQVGRWTAKDPIGFAGGDSNLFIYALSDPGNRMDPNGTEATNRCGCPVLVKPESDADPNVWLKPGGTYPKEIDGVKPPFWGGDWLKVPDGGSIDIDPLGNPTASWGGGPLPTFFGDPKKNGPWDRLPGRKFEPEWTAPGRHPDWNKPPTSPRPTPRPATKWCPVGAP